VATGALILSPDLAASKTDVEGLKERQKERERERVKRKG
jgi:hypothetical protein